jgi:hypothetical protein
MQHALVSEINEDKLFSIIIFFFPFAFLWEHMDMHEGLGIGFRIFELCFLLSVILWTCFLSFCQPTSTLVFIEASN